ncbi:MAG: DNA polymerase III subunit beta [Candidatus Gribaldobacteria bacterium]|nr:DNA polymerase III subunit beta [Candidatus Gribaldobacteria bacterium]
MKLEIFKEEFKKALMVCERITKKALGLPILQNVLLRAEGNHLELTTTNLETTIKYWVLAKIEKGGELTVPASFLANLVNLTRAEKLNLLEENDQLILLSQDQESQMPTQSAQDFPLVPKVESLDVWQVGVEDIVAGLTQIIEVPSVSQLRPEITGIFFSFKKDKLKIAGTDSFRLAEKTINIYKPGKKEGNFILPQGSAREILNILGAQKGQVNICFTNNQVLFEVASENPLVPVVKILSRLIEGDYPPYQEIIPHTTSTQIRVEREALIGQIKQAGLFAGKLSEVKLKTIIKDRKLRVFTQSPEVGKSESFLSCQITGADLEVAFNYRFLLGGLANIKGSEIVLECSGPDKAGVIKPVGDISYLYVL